MLTVAAVVVIEPVPIATAGAQDGMTCNPGQAPGQVQVGCIVEWVSGGGSGGPDGGGSGGADGGGGGFRPVCGWVAANYEDMDLDERQALEVADQFASEPLDGSMVAQWWRKACAGEYCPVVITVGEEPEGGPGAGLCDGIPNTLDMTLVEPGEAVPPGVPVELFLLNRAWLEAQGYPKEPTLAMHPSEGNPTIVQMPTFVEVTNWEDTWDDGSGTPSCATPPDGEVCVTMSWTTDLWYVPGDGDEVLCDPPPGKVFDDNDQRDPFTQARDSDACTHIYRQHTAGGETYSGEVRVDWNFTWESSTGWGGEFDPVQMATSFEREVDEVQVTTEEFPELEEAE